MRNVLEDVSAEKPDVGFGFGRDLRLLAGCNSFFVDFYLYDVLLDFFLEFVAQL